MANRCPARALAPAALSSPTTGTPDPIRLHAAAHNALSTAMHYLHEPQANLAGARRKVLRALVAIRRLDVSLRLEG